MSKLLALINHLRLLAGVILKAAPTWLTAVAVALTVVHEEVAGLLPAGAAETVGQLVVIALGWIGAAVAIIRRVTPVTPSERGILPPG